MIEPERTHPLFCPLHSVCSDRVRVEWTLVLIASLDLAFCSPFFCASWKRLTVIVWMTRGSRQPSGCSAPRPAPKPQLLAEDRDSRLRQGVSPCAARACVATHNHMKALWRWDQSIWFTVFSTTPPRRWNHPEVPSMPPTSVTSPPHQDHYVHSYLHSFSAPRGLQWRAADKTVRHAMARRRGCRRESVLRGFPPTTTTRLSGARERPRRILTAMTRLRPLFPRLCGPKVRAAGLVASRSSKASSTRAAAAALAWSAAAALARSAATALAELVEAA